MTRYDFELEIRAYFETQKIMSGNGQTGPSPAFLEKVKELTNKPVTPKELGWDK